MPKAAPTICQCGKVRPSGQRCTCAPVRVDHRPSATKRGYDEGWKLAAKAFLAAPGNERCRCGAPATCVAHILSIRLYPSLRMNKDNWRPSCRSCNTSDTYREKDGGVGPGLSRSRAHHTRQSIENSGKKTAVPFFAIGDE
ncbi:endonuclease [Mesorhizobium sp. LHD-90]|uniref:endonuclease n=1 Tax=Mesorhizobium sp. LHD-90 TaxID=3071414 RepID=UPI0027E0EDDD|nr:endonuclease [Mesorhizobium sp. LHD-90]MDQ6434383.1 endonuclease [Mesorhizobium sp. LHD-90]